MISTYNTGLLSEGVASLFLKFKLYKILSRRYKTYVGELDIVAKKGRSLVFVEVKTIKGKNIAFPAISQHQINRIKRASYLYLAKNTQYNELYDVRFDLITVSNFIKLKHYKNVW